MSSQIKVTRFFLLCCLMFASMFQTVNAADWLYTMRPGDTIWSVCKTHTKEPSCWQKLGPLNNIARDRAIPPGTRIRVPVDWLNTPPASATLVFVQGEVNYQMPGEARLPAVEGVELRIGATLATGNGTASLLFADGSSMLLEPNSQLELDTLSNFELNGMVDSTVRLHRGTVKTRVIKREPRSHFRTITPSAVAAVRGTEYRVNVRDLSKENQHQVNQEQVNTSKQATLVEVYQGLVDVGAEQVTFPVPASFGIVAKQGEVLQKPVKLLEKPEFLAFKERQTALLNNAGKVADPIQLEWQAMATAEAYQLNIFADQQDDKTEKLLKGYRTKATNISLSDLSLACYTLSLRAVDQLGLQGLASQKRLCIEQQIMPPVVNTLASSTDDKQQVQLSWENVDDAQAYRIEIADSSDFDSGLSSIETLDTRYTLDKQNSSLFVRVQALSESGDYSRYSQTIQVQPKELKEDKSIWALFIPVGFFILAIL